ncbi:spore coat sp96 precursor [Fusarium longipes]|uniref:Spore coat sp96 n=1 Tax=Fusarium longipes TaxID=694270 RepID=A0A395T4W0_9HYPO|nr:spore coat sp96 precursor [Fusarium longipes]
MHFNSFAMCLGLAGLAQAHMEMISPAPFKSKENPHAGSDVDYSMTAPLEAGGGNFPCKGYHSLFGTEQGASVADWDAGSQQTMKITGGANHGGGSCQASLSFDKGETWQVIHSYIGNCPAAGTSSFDFKVPSDAPSGEAIFAWTWFNQIGNREMYMNCAAVTIKGGSKRASTMSNRPEMFVANVGNGCTTEESSDLEFPNPGPDVSNDSQKTAGPKGSCAKAGSGGGSGSGSGDGAAPSAPADNGNNNGAAPSTPAGGNDGSYNPGNDGSGAASSAPAAPAPTQPSGGAPDAPGGVFITVSQPAEATAAPSAPANDGAGSSTLLTMTKPAEQPAPTSVVTPEPAPAAPTAPDAGAGQGGSGTEEAAGSACTEEGQWNCIGGSKYQRCASGTWSVVQSMAAGTTCSGSKSSVMAFGFGRKLAFRFRRV